MQCLLFLEMDCILCAIRKIMEISYYGISFIHIKLYLVNCAGAATYLPRASANREN